MDQLTEVIKKELDNYSWGKDEEEAYIKELIPLLKPILTVSFDLTETRITGVNPKSSKYHIDRPTTDGKLIMNIGKDSRLNAWRFFRQFGPAKLSFWTRTYVK